MEAVILGAQALTTSWGDKAYTVNHTSRQGAHKCAVSEWWGS